MPPPVTNTTAMWSNARDKKGWQILKALGRLKLASGGLTADPLGSVSWDSIPSGLADLDVVRAHAIAETGDYAVMLVIESAAEFDGEDVTRRTWKAIEPEAGAHAAIFMAHWLAESFAQLARSTSAHFGVEPHEQAAHLLREWFPWSESDEATVKGLASREDVQEARLELVMTMLSRLLGERTAGDLPGLVPYDGFGPERFLADTHWQVCWNHAQLPYLRMADPDGLARWEAAQAVG